MSVINYIYERNQFTSDNDRLLLDETIFHSANGYLGVRSALEEGYPEGFKSIRGQYINAFHETVEMPQAEKLHGLVEEKQTILNIGDTQTIQLHTAGEAFSMFNGTVQDYRMTLDMRCGYVTRALSWVSTGGRRSDIRIRRMASFVHPSLFLIDYEVTPQNYSGDICFESLHQGEGVNYADPNDPRVAGESQQYLFAEPPIVSERLSMIKAVTKRSGLAVYSGVYHQLTGGGQQSVITTAGTAQVSQKLKAYVRQGETVRLLKYCVFSDSLHHKDPEKHVREVMEEVNGIGPEALYQEQISYLEQFWKNSELCIQGDEELDLAVRYNQYQLLQSAGQDGIGSVAAKGLSGEGYEGHFFWDTEMYIQPFFLLTNPEMVRQLLSYRHRILPYARRNALALGHRQGALYPWRTINGEECSGYFPSGTAQYHISGDIAYAVIQYYLMTKDDSFIREQGAEIVIETARLWTDTAVLSDGYYQIHEVTGPDEYTCMVSNNYYTNALAKYNLEWAVRFALLAPETASVTGEEIKMFQEIADNMYLPYHEELGINPQDDSFLRKQKWNFDETPAEHYPLLLHYHPLCLYRHQVCKQADTVLSHVILEQYQERETMRRSFDYYESVTTHDSSLSACIFSIAAARLGLFQKACEYFGESAKLDLFDTHGNTKDGIHTANMGGAYMAIVYGFGGLRIKEEHLYLAPFLPKGWERYHFRTAWRESRLQVEVEDGRIIVSLLEGREVKLCLYGEELILKDRIMKEISNEV